MIVPKKQGPVTHHEVDISVSVDVALAATRSATETGREWRDPARVVVDAAGDDLRGSFVGLRGISLAEELSRGAGQATLSDGSVTGISQFSMSAGVSRRLTRIACPRSTTTTAGRGTPL
jgi:hypothetical protein